MHVVFYPLCDIMLFMHACMHARCRNTHHSVHMQSIYWCVLSAAAAVGCDCILSNILNNCMNHMAWTLYKSFCRKITFTSGELCWSAYWGYFIKCENTINGLHRMFGVPCLLCSFSVCERTHTHTIAGMVLCLRDENARENCTII